MPRVVQALGLEEGHPEILEAETHTPTLLQDTSFEVLTFTRKHRMPVTECFSSYHSTCRL